MTANTVRGHGSSTTSGKSFATDFFSTVSVVVSVLILFVMSPSSWTTISTAGVAADAETTVSSSSSSLLSSSSSSSSLSSYVTSCRSVGFDPFTLACTTCDLLLSESSASKSPSLLDDDSLKTKFEKCYDCCESWKSLDSNDEDAGGDGDKHDNNKGTKKRKMNRKYKFAVLVHANVAGYYPSVDELIREDKERIVEETRPNSFQIKIASTGGEDSDNEMLQMAMMMGRMDMIDIEPSTILWFDHHHPAATTSKPGTAVELTSLSVDELKQLAAERTPLRGMKRDDIREMLLALLPPSTKP